MARTKAKSKAEEIYAALDEAVETFYTKKKSKTVLQFKDGSVLFAYVLACNAKEIPGRSRLLRRLRPKDAKRLLAYAKDALKQKKKASAR